MGFLLERVGMNRSGKRQNDQGPLIISVADEAFVTAQPCCMRTVLNGNVEITQAKDRKMSWKEPAPPTHTGFNTRFLGQLCLHIHLFWWLSLILEEVD